MELQLERKGQTNETPVISTPDGAAAIMLSPLVDEDYWAYRVKLSDTQAVVGFPKYSTIGIGFAVEDDWNTNLPFTSETERIFAWILKNKGDESIPDDDVRQAIRLIQDAVVQDRAAEAAQ